MADSLARRAYELEVQNIRSNLSRELADVRRALDAMNERLTSGSASTVFAAEARRLVAAASDAAAYAGSLDIANRLVFLIDDKED